MYSTHRLLLHQSLCSHPDHTAGYTTHRPDAQTCIYTHAHTRTRRLHTHVQDEDGHVTAESAQPRKASNVTRPFSSREGGLGTRLLSQQLFTGLWYASLRKPMVQLTLHYAMLQASVLNGNKLDVAWAQVPHWSCWYSCDVMPGGHYAYKYAGSASLAYSLLQQTFLYTQQA